MATPRPNGTKKTTKKARTSPPKPVRRTGIARIEWSPYKIDGLDVRLFQATYYDHDGDEVIPEGIPAIDTGYVFREDMVRELAWAVWPHDNDDPAAAPNWTPCLLAGPKGSGKTSLVLQVAARCNIRVFRTNLNVGTTTRHLKGRLGAQDGRTVFVPGVATMAMERGGWLLLDELSGVTPPVALSLFPIMEAQGSVLLEDAQPPRYVKRSPYFRVICTDNCIGAMQEESRFSYSGTNPDMNEALLDRIGSVIEVPYLTEDREHQAIASMIPTVDSDNLEGMIRVANAVRQSHEVAGGFSTRMVMEWARRATAGIQKANGKVVHPVEDDNFLMECAQAAFLRRQNSLVERDAIAEVIRRVFAIDADDEVGF